MSATCPVCHERVLLGERFCASCGATIGLLGPAPGHPGMVDLTSEGGTGIRPLPPSPPRPIDPPVPKSDRRRPLVVAGVVLVAALVAWLAALALGFGDDDDRASLPTPASVSTEDEEEAPDGVVGTPSVRATPRATPVAMGDVGTPPNATVVASPEPGASPAIASPIVEIMPAPSGAATPPVPSGVVDAAGLPDSTQPTVAGREAGEATDVQPRLVRALQRATLAYLRSGAAGPPHSVFEALSQRWSPIDSAGVLAIVVGDLIRELAVESMDPPVPSALPEPPSPSFTPSGGAESESRSGPERPTETPVGGKRAGTLCLTDGRSCGGFGERCLRCDDADV